MVLGSTPVWLAEGSLFTDHTGVLELLWYLTESLTLQPARPLHGELSLAFSETERLTHISPDALLELDVAAHRRDISALLLRTSELVQAQVRHKRKAAIVEACDGTIGAEAICSSVSPTFLANTTLASHS